MPVNRWVRTLGGKVRPYDARHPSGLVRATHGGRAQGDAARDLRDWPRAVIAYRSYLEAVPDDAAIWVQLGHALKETGAYAEAEAAYLRALELTPLDSDLLLQLGHLQKLRGRIGDATRFYEASLNADAASAAYGELVALGKSTRAEAALNAGRERPVAAKTYFQIDDVLVFLASHKTVSGIQRVQVEVIRDVLNRAPDRHAAAYGFVFTEPFGTRIREAPGDILRSLVEYLDEPVVEHAPIARMIDDIKAQAVLVDPAAGSTFVMLGAFWAAVNNSNVLARLRRNGVSLGVYFYDFIPVEYPELCDPMLANCFTQFLSEALFLVDYAFCISRFTADEVRRFIAREGFPDIPVEVVPLAHSLSTLRQAGAADSYRPIWSDATRDLKDRDFVLYVSTIEARKNHKYLFDIWKLLIAEGIEVPDLVFVGRHGWRVSEFIDQMKATDYLDGRIHILHDLSDRELETLYRECRFTAFTSIVEGWGLPVGESLAYGKLCVCSSASSMPEVGADLVAYVDPLNIREGLQTIRHLLLDPSAVSDYERAIRERFVPRAWADVSADLLEMVSRLSASHSASGNPIVPTLEPRVRIQIADYSPFADPFSARLPSRPTERVKRLLLAESWHCPEVFGAWMEGPEGKIRFATTLAPGEKVMVMLEFTSTPSAKDNVLTISDPSGESVSVHIPTGCGFRVRYNCATDDKAEVSLTLWVDGEMRFGATDPRQICMGLVALTYVAKQDAAGRAEILEAELFDSRLKLYTGADA